VAYGLSDLYGPDGEPIASPGLDDLEVTVPISLCKTHDTDLVRNPHLDQISWCDDVVALPREIRTACDADHPTPTRGLLVIELGMWAAA